MIRQPSKGMLLITAIAFVALIIGVQQGYAACATARPEGSDSYFSCINVPDPACGTSSITIQGNTVTWTNLCVSEPCGSIQRACPSGTS
jgi:hypothetical protein